MDPNRPSCFPSSVALEITTPEAERDPYQDTPSNIFIHPESYFHMDVRDHSLSLSLSPPLPSAYSAIRFPTLTAFLDTLISTLLDPPLGYRHGLLSLELMCYVAYFLTYTAGIRDKERALPNGDLEPEHAAVVRVFGRKIGLSSRRNAELTANLDGVIMWLLVELCLNH